jgi:hypothetical protein
MSVRELADIDASRIELINEFEVKVTEYRNATSDLMGIKYAKGAFFGMSTLLTAMDKYLYCFLLIIYLFESHSYMQLEILHQIRVSLQEMW